MAAKPRVRSLSSALKFLGGDISTPEITHISTHGVWLLASGHELFISHDEFPWFKDAPVKHIINIYEVSPGHLYWPDLDVDLSLESIIHPERFPLKAHSNQQSVRSCRAQLPRKQI